MSLKTYIEFGSIVGKKKRRYQTLKGDLYDSYMLSRYFRDLHNLSLINKNNFRNHCKKLHHKKDLKFNFINYLFLIIVKSKSFYEFGQTLFEKIFFMKFFTKIFKKKINFKIKWCGNDISKMFNFFCINFYKNYKINVFEKPNYKLIKNSIFFSKGVSLLYYEKNINLIKYVLKNSYCGSFDFTVCKKKTKQFLNTGYKLHYPSKKEFLKIIPKDKEQIILFKNLKQDEKFLYFEVIFGKKNIVTSVLKLFNFFKVKFKKNNPYLKNFDLNTKFYDLTKFKLIDFN